MYVKKDKDYFRLISSTSQRACHHVIWTLCCFSEGEIIASYSLNVRCFCLDIDGDVIYIGTDTGALRFENGQASPIEFPEFTPTVVRPPLAVPDNIAMPRMFTLDGRQIDGNTTKKGIVIKNGRKVVQR